MTIVHRLFAAILIAVAGVWIWAILALRQEIVAVDSYYAQQVAPHIEASKQEIAAFDQALRDRHEGKNVPLPQFKRLNAPPLGEWVEHIKRRNRYILIRDLALLSFMGAAMAWTVAATIQADVRRRRWESPDRAAIPDAGKVIGELVRSGNILLAKAGDGVAAPSVEVDGRRAMVVFRHFTFVTTFVGNRKKALTEVPFTDLLAGSVRRDKRRAFLTLRTTSGKVVVSDRLQPFQELVKLLLDAVELNRTFPDQYRAALAREPRVRTPWYGWLIIAAALAAVAVVWWWFFRN